MNANPDAAPRQTMVVSFDMETDIGSWTFEQRGIIEGTPQILDVLRRHGVKSSFMFTGREAKNNPSVVERILSGGHEIGCHTMYHETVGDETFETIFNNHTLPGEVMPRLELATNTVERVASVRPVSFRAPRLFGSLRRRGDDPWNGLGTMQRLISIRSSNACYATVSRVVCITPSCLWMKAFWRR